MSNEVKVVHVRPRNFFLVVLWVMGIILAEGFWSTFFAFLIPFWGWYVTIRFFLHYFGVL